jgi:dTDP-4-amino-4,6-dideoxygalactose transaminase
MRIHIRAFSVTVEVRLPINRHFPLAKPLLPRAPRIAPYLREIDRTGLYTNFGPLSRSLEERLVAQFGASPGGVAAASSGTAALTAALLTVSPTPGGLCLMPSWTFVGTPAAALAAGLVPYFVDVTAGTWAIDPEKVSALVQRLPVRPAAVVPVAPFGAPLDAEAWDAFTQTTGIAVVIDGAAAFDSARAFRTPTVISLHATKVLGVGEGGLVASTDPSIITAIRTRTNFGYVADRVVRVTGVNAKLSEYAAAVGLAALDEWPSTRRTFETLTNCYAVALANIAGVSLSPGFGAGWVSSTCNIVLTEPVADEVIAYLGGRAIETRQWWGRGCHRQPAFAHLPRTPLPVTESLADRCRPLRARCRHHRRHRGHGC